MLMAVNGPRISFTVQGLQTVSSSAGKRANLKVDFDVANGFIRLTCKLHCDFYFVHYDLVTFTAFEV